MSLHVKIMDCNGACRSCYERRIRRTQGPLAYNLEAMLASLRREAERERPEDRKKHSAPCVHGGEPLMFKPEDLRTILKTMFDLYGRTGIQTNGTLMTDEHVAMFREFKTSVGVSIDGDTAALNRGRWNDGDITESRIQELTDLTMKNIERARAACPTCGAAGLNVSAIIVLRRYNAAPDRLDELVRFLLRLEKIGVRSIRTNEVIVFEDRFRDEELTEAELGRAFIRLADLCFEDAGRQWYPYRDIAKMWTEGGDATCVFNACDIWKTGAETAITADGSLGVCLKGGAALDGIQALAADIGGTERILALPAIPQEQGGCQGCEFWGLCGGGCPGSGIGNDWRTRTRFCGSYKTLFQHVRSRLKGIMPGVALKNPAERAKRWACETPAGGGHGDGHGDEHGDKAHGDHSDG
jgi:uncharacterized protein